MKRRGTKPPEKRRSTAEINLIGETRARAAAASRGCASLLSRLVAGVLLGVLLWQGLS